MVYCVVHNASKFSTADEAPMDKFQNTDSALPSDLLVSQDELRQVSGYKQPSRIRAWLVKNRIRFLMPREGDPWPRVMRKTFQQKFSKTISELVQLEPDLSWMKPHEPK